MQKEIEKAVAQFKKALAAIRTGRAHPGVLDEVQVHAYGGGGITPLKHLASVVVEDATTLLLTVYDPSIVSNVEKALKEAGMNPRSAGQTLRVSVPALTQTRRQELIKRVRNEAEQARIWIRGIRRQYNDEVKAAVKSKTMGQDMQLHFQEQHQKWTDQGVQEIDRLCKEKEQDLAFGA